jgi:hypothetical protein
VPGKCFTDSLTDAFKRRIGRITEPQILFPITALLLLAAVWTMTFGIIRVRQSATVHAASAASSELLDTYEAQVVRALRDIDQSLNLVKFWHERELGRGAITKLRDSGLFPPDLLFEVSVADSAGTLVESTRSYKAANVSEQDYFRAQRRGDSFFVAQIPRGEGWDSKLRFSRRLSGSNGEFDGVVIVAVDAANVVSGYETSQLGETQGSQPTAEMACPDGCVPANCTAFRSPSSSVLRYASSWPAHRTTRASI